MHMTPFKQNEDKAAKPTKSVCDTSQTSLHAQLEDSVEDSALSDDGRFDLK